MADDAPKSFRETLDSARDQVLTSARKSFDGVKESVKTANPYLGEKLEQTEGAVTKLTTEFEEKGFWCVAGSSLTPAATARVAPFSPRHRAAASAS